MEDAIPSIEEIAHQTSALSTQPILRLKPDPAKTCSLKNHVLLGKIIADQELHAPTVEDRMRFSWKLLHGLHISRIETNVYRFAFDSEAERRRIMLQAPWSVLGHHLVLKQWDPATTEDNMDFSQSEFWIQVHGLPLDHITADNARRIGELFEGLMDYDLAGNEKSVGLDYIRLKVKIKVEEPLIIGFDMEGESSIKKWIWFRYERLPNFCYNCGRLSHTKQTCIYAITGDISKAERKFGIRSYGPLMRADEKIPSKNKERAAGKSATTPSEKLPEIRNMGFVRSRYGAEQPLNLLPFPQPPYSPLEPNASDTSTGSQPNRSPLQGPDKIKSPSKALPNDMGQNPHTLAFNFSANPLSQPPIKIKPKRKKTMTQKWTSPKRIKLQPAIKPSAQASLSFFQTYFDVKSFFSSDVANCHKIPPHPTPATQIEPLPEDKHHSSQDNLTHAIQSEPCPIDPQPSVVCSELSLDLGNPASLSSRPFKWKRMARQNHLVPQSPKTEEAGPNKPPTPQC